ncbi:MAG: thiolase family protein [Deltaproteobacteria bacterium]|nr:thiolase family protein [Deltaproteobacteria bacterium]
MRDAVIVDVVRTARGKKKGSLKNTHPMDLLAHCYKGVLKRNNVDAKHVDDAIAGCVTQTNEQGLNIGRGAVLAAGLPMEIPGTTINRFCGSGLQAINFAAQAVMSGAEDVVLAGGVESMTRVMMGSDFGPPPTSLTEKYALVPQGISAEMVAEKWGISREECDRFGYESQRKAVAAIEAGKFKNEILAIEVENDDGTKRLFDSEEHPRPDASVEKMGTLMPSFKPDGVITAGNSSGIVDGAAVALVMTSDKAKSLGLKPRARVVSMAIVGSEPVIMLTGPMPATELALKKAGLRMDQIDLYEVNEAFAPVPIAWTRDMKADPAKLNVNGGAIALGHPLGATGCILTGTIIGELERRKARYGLVTLCIGYGMGIATIFERLG